MLKEEATEFPGIVLDTSILSRLNPPEHEKTYDMLIIGGGAAAMCAAIYAARKTLAVAMISVDIGGQKRVRGYEKIKFLDFLKAIGKQIKETSNKDIYREYQEYLRV